MNKKVSLSVLLAVLFFPTIGFAQGGSQFCAAMKSVQMLVYQIGGSIVIIGWVIAGILYLTGMGQPEKLGIAKKALTAAVIGTILVILAQGASTLVTSALNFTGAVPTCT